MSLLQAGNANTYGLATEDTLKSIAGFNIPPFDEKIIDETDAPTTTIITYKKGGVTVATQTISVSGKITTISI